MFGGSVRDGCMCVREREREVGKTESKKKLWVQGFVLAGNHAGWFLSDNKDLSD